MEQKSFVKNSMNWASSDSKFSVEMSRSGIHRARAQKSVAISKLAIEYYTLIISTLCDMPLAVTVVALAFIHIIFSYVF